MTVLLVAAYVGVGVGVLYGAAVVGLFEEYVDYILKGVAGVAMVAIWPLFVLLFLLGLLGKALTELSER